MEAHGEGANAHFLLGHQHHQHIGMMLPKYALVTYLAKNLLSAYQLVLNCRTIHIFSPTVFCGFCLVINQHQIASIVNNGR